MDTGCPLRGAGDMSLSGGVVPVAWSRPLSGQLQSWGGLSAHRPLRSRRPHLAARVQMGDAQIRHGKRVGRSVPVRPQQGGDGLSGVRAVIVNPEGL